MNTPSEGTPSSDFKQSPLDSASIKRLHDSLNEVRRKKELVALERSLHREESIRRHKTHDDLMLEAAKIASLAEFEQQELAQVQEVPNLHHHHHSKQRRASQPLAAAMQAPNGTDVARQRRASQPLNLEMLAQNLPEPGQPRAAKPRRQIESDQSLTAVMLASNAASSEQAVQHRRGHASENLSIGHDRAAKQRRASQPVTSTLLTPESLSGGPSGLAPSPARSSMAAPANPAPRRASYAPPFDPNAVVPSTKPSAPPAAVPVDPVIERRSREEAQALSDVVAMPGVNFDKDSILPHVAKYHLEQIQAERHGFSIRSELALMRVAFQRELAGKNLDFDSDTSLGTINWLQAFGTTTNRFLHNRVGFALFRLITAILMVGILVWSMTAYYLDGNISFWAIYLTNWVATIDASYCVLSFIMTCRMGHYENTPCYHQNPRMLPLLVRVVWFLQGLALPCSALVVIVFWLFVVDFEQPPALYSVFTHGVNFILVGTDVFISNQPFLLLHGLYFVILAVIYGTWTVIFHVLNLTDAAGNPYIYSAVDWSHPLSTGTLGFILVIFVFPMLVLALWWALFVRRTTKLYKQVLSAVRAAQDELDDLEKASRKAQAADPNNLPRMPSFVLAGEANCRS